MSLDAPAQASPPVRSIDDLVSWMRAGEKAVSNHRVGLETEKLGVDAQGEPASLEAIGRLLKGVAESTGGQLLVENGAAIGVQLAGSSVALEPGGQLELSGAPTARLGDLATELEAHLAMVRRLSSADGLSWLGLGARPFGERSAVPWLPRGRYALMRQRMRGAYAHDMMQMTASVQVNLDFTDEADLAAKASCATALSPIVSALYANSPLSNGKPNGRKSYRYHVWSDVDPSRCGLLRFMYEPGFTYRRYLEWALAAPLLFVRRGGAYVDPEGRNFGDLIRDGFLGQPATMADFTDLMSTLFPEIRIKRVIEVRGADAVSVPMTLALPALWLGLLYDPTARTEARQLVNVPFDDLVGFQDAVSRDGLEARLGGQRAEDLARDIVALAAEGLSRRVERGAGDTTDASLLDPLREVIETGRAPADDLLRTVQKTGGDRAAIIASVRY